MRYQIKDWDTHFENDRSRSRRHCSFVCVPNKQHGMGFSRIMAEPDGAAIYGIWHMILGACSQQAERDGWLTENGDMAGSPWGVDDLALKFRRPEAEVQRALDFLCSDKVKWIIYHGTNDLQSSHRPVTVQSPSSTLKEEKRREEKEENAYSPESRVILHFLNEKSGKHFRETKTSLAPINARLKEPDVETEGVKRMVSRQCQMWTGTRMQEYLRPETLFGEEKFNAYYAARDLPVSLEDRKQPEMSQNGY